jgi:glutamate-5-semialdehyde dehydrogenase
MSENTEQQIIELCQQAKKAATQLALLSAEQKREILYSMATEIAERSEQILAANATDVALANDAQQNAAFIDRLTLTQKTIANMVDGVKKIADLPEPVGKVLSEWQVKSGLLIRRVSVPLGVIAVIYESRPNVTVDAAALCLKSGNAVILRGGSECVHTNKILLACLQAALTKHVIDSAAIQAVPTQERHAITLLLQHDQFIDVVIPRGGRGLIENISKVSRVPVFKHLDGICHTYVHREAELAMAVEIILNAKLRRTGICGATETILLDRIIAEKFLPVIIAALSENHCEIRGDDIVQSYDSRVLPATEQDWSTEYLDAIVSIKTVDNLAEAIAHINRYGSHHTDAIITEDHNAVATFMQQVDSAIVMHNCSTQFADGGEFGMGAEIGIATGKLHARGPVGIEQLTTFKYQVEGCGQVRS